MNNALPQAILASLLVSSVSAQRSWSGATYMDEVAGRLFTHDGASTQAKWGWETSGVWVDGVVAVPWPTTGAVALVEPTGFLVAGYDAGAGWIAEVSITGGSAQVSAVSLHSQDLVSLCYNSTSGLVFGIDNLSSTVVCASYVAGAPVGAWTAIATSQDCGALASEGSLLRLEPNLVTGGVWVRPGEHVGGVECELVQSAGVWGASSPSAAVQLPPDIWTVGTHPLLTTSTSFYDLWVGGGVGAFNVVDIATGAVAYSAVHSGAPWV